jgi:hypothetical protein
MNRKFLIVTALVAGVATTAEAQLCAGTAPFSAGQMRVGVGAEFPTGAKTYGGEFAWGHQSGAYLGGTIARTADDQNSDINALDMGVNGGYEMTFESMPRLRLCPTASFGFINGPDIGTIESSTMHYSVGAAAGTAVAASENIAIVPSAAIRWVGARDKTTQGGSSSTVSDSWFQARLAAGIVFNRAITIAPTVTIPFQDGAENTYGVALSYNFGRSGGVMQQGSRKKSRRR